MGSFVEAMIFNEYYKLTSEEEEYARKIEAYIKNLSSEQRKDSKKRIIGPNFHLKWRFSIMKESGIPIPESIKKELNKYDEDGDLIGDSFYNLKKFVKSHKHEIDVNIDDSDKMENIHQEYIDWIEALSKESSLKINIKTGLNCYLFEHFVWLARIIMRQ
jgi:hypothetical protein